MQNIKPDLQIMNYRIPKLIIQPLSKTRSNTGSRDSLKICDHTEHTQYTVRLIISISDNGSVTPEQLRTLDQKLAGK